MLTLALLGAASPALEVDELDRAERARLDAGEVVVRTRSLADFPWPEVTAYRRVRAAAAEVMAVYGDFGGQVRWVPELVAGRVVARDARNVFRVFYEYEVPGPNERYVVTITVARADDGFDARWRLLEARYARRLAGEIRVRPFGVGSVITYRSRVDPGPIGIMFGTPNSVERRLTATVDSLAKRVEHLAATDPAMLGGLVQALHITVGGP